MSASGVEDRPARSAAPAREVRREAYTMALYVAVVLLAALIALADPGDDPRVAPLGLVWGTAIGLALAHFFAFRVSARLVAGGELGRDEAGLALAQLAGAIVVAVLVSVPVLVLPASAELEGAVLVLAGFVAAAGFAVARTGGAGRTRAALYALVVLAIGVGVAVVKNTLAGH